MHKVILDELRAVIEALGGSEGVEDGECIAFLITGTLNDGTPIAGQDVVHILKKVRAPKPSKSLSKGLKH